MLVTPIVFFGVDLVLICDARCNKAWGINGRPKEQLSDDEDDIAYLADEELGDAPSCPGTWEGRDGKPQTPDVRHNKWCARECERSKTVKPGTDFELPDFSRRLFNQPWKHQVD